MKKFDTMGEDWTVTETGTGTDRNGPETGTGTDRNGPESGTGTGMGRKAEQEPEWAGSRNMKRQKYRKRIAYNER